MKIRLTGNRALDFERAFEKMGILNKNEMYRILHEEEFTWHHLDDLNENLESTCNWLKRKHMKPR